MSQPIASLHCLFSYDNRLGGSVHAALNVCQALAQGGQPVEVVAPVGPGDELAYLGDSYAGLACHQVPRSFPTRYSNSRQLGRWLEDNAGRFRVAEIHGIWVLSAWQAARACRRRGLPYLVRPHGSLDPFDLRKHAVLKKCIGPLYVQWLLRHAAGVVCTAELEVTRLVTYGARPRCCAMPLPVPLSDQPGDGARFRARYGIPADARVVLFLSRIDYKKGLEDLIRALGILRREHPRTWFVLAGAGTAAFTSRVHAWLEQHGVRPFTSEVGFLSGQEKLDALAGADVFALPSLNENFGIVNIEAMHAGLPVLISDEVYICREIERAGAGVICRPDGDSVLAKLRILLDGTVDLKEMGQKGRELVRQRYQPAMATAELLALYREVLARGPVPTQ